MQLQRKDITERLDVGPQLHFRNLPAIHEHLYDRTPGHDPIVIPLVAMMNARQQLLAIAQLGDGFAGDLLRSRHRIGDQPLFAKASAPPRSTLIVDESKLTGNCRDIRLQSNDPPRLRILQHRAELHAGVGKTLRVLRREFDLE